MPIRNTIKSINSRIDSYLAPQAPGRMQTYRDILFNQEFSRALHFGSGRDKRGLGTKLEEKGEVIAIDPDQSGIDENTVQDKVLGDGQRLPFDANSFDLVFSEYVFEHLPDPHAALSEIDRVLRSGGTFLVLVPNPNHYYARIADLTPFWFHELWFRLQGVEDHKKDKFPTQYVWGTYSDVTEVGYDWSLDEFHSFPGPTSYTKILPIHFLFTILDRLAANNPECNVCYICMYVKSNAV